MSDDIFKSDMNLAARMADAARLAILPHFRSRLDVENKLDQGFDPVTIADRASETAMRDILAAERPDDGVLGEEFGETPSVNGRKWVLDPIDGTRAFIAGLPTWTILIALSNGEKPHLGLIDQPHIEERFIGGPDGSFYQRGTQRTRLESRKTRTLETAVMATTDIDLFTDPEKLAFRRVLKTVQLCRYGYDAYAYAMLAMGGIDLVIESSLQPYDVQALIPVVEGAGGVVTNWQGGAAWDGGQVIASAHKALHDEALAFLESAAV